MLVRSTVSKLPKRLSPVMPRNISTSRAVKQEKPLYASQPSMPHLPVPTLQSTFHKYIETIQPLQTPSEHQKSVKAITEFMNSKEAATLQDRLEKRAAERDSWLSEWWNETAYMGFRGRILPWVNYFYVHKKGLGKGKSQEDRAAELVRATVEFKKLVDSEMLEPEKAKGKPFCSASYKYLFNAVRVPTTPADIPLAYPADKNHHIIVLHNDRYWKVDTKGRSASQLADAFRQIKAASKERGSGVGILTADDRDLWTDARRKLMEISQENTKSIQAFESAILLVCLEDATAPSEDARSWSLWVGGNDRTPAGKGFNRWFDKHQIIVDSTGDSGFNGEHSMLDGTPTLRFNEFMLGSLDKGMIPLELSEGEKNTAPFPAPEEVKFELNSDLKSIIEKSRAGFGEEMQLQDLKTVNYTGYGKETIKAHKVSPDAWAQMIKQLAFYRLFGRPGVTYEACATRAFLLGRTEVIRSASNESKAFCESMLNSKASDLEREKLFRKAVGRHIQYSSWAAQAQGVDRHMFGLKKLVQADQGETVPAVLSDEIFAKSSHWSMSTSQLSSKFLDGWGYGEVVDDGYGLAYWILDNEIGWSITTKNNDAAKFGEALKEAADDVRGMMDRAKAEGEGEGERSRL